jgi:hypothetical protein
MTQAKAKQKRPSRSFFNRMIAKNEKFNPDKLSQVDLLIMLGLDRDTADTLVEYAKGDLFNLDGNLEVQDLLGVPGIAEGTVLKIVSLFVLCGRFYNRIEGETIAA